MAFGSRLGRAHDARDGGLTWLPGAECKSIMTCNPNSFAHPTASIKYSSEPWM